MPGTTPSTHICPVCNRGHLNATYQGRQTMLRMGLTDLEIENISHVGNDRSQVPAPSRHRLVTPKDRTSLIMQYGLDPGVVDTIALEAQNRYGGPDQPNDPGLVHPILETLMSMAPSELQSIEEMGAELEAALLPLKEDPLERHRRLNAERQARFKGKQRRKQTP